MTVNPDCFRCRHYRMHQAPGEHEGAEGVTYHCRAYPLGFGGIPMPVLLGPKTVGTICARGIGFEPAQTRHGGE